MRGYRAAVVTIAIVLGGCRYGPGDFVRRVRSESEADLSWSPPPAPAAEGEPLYQLLYRDEVGEQSRPAGQRARMLAWLRWMELEPDQVVGLIELVQIMAQVRAAEAVDQAAAGAMESKHLSPIYESLIVALSGPTTPQAADLAEWSQQLADAHTSLDAQRDPRAWQQAHVQTILEAVNGWMTTLYPHQIRKVSDARFFLRRRMGALVNPGHYGWVIGSHWDGGDFDTLRFLETDEDPPHLDIGGLWNSESYRADAAQHIRLKQAQIILAMAITEPGLKQSIEVLQGTRSPLDFDRQN